MPNKETCNDEFCSFTIRQSFRSMTGKIQIEGTGYPKRKGGFISHDVGLDFFCSWGLGAKDLGAVHEVRKLDSRDSSYHPSVGWPTPRSP
jgi:hypothetical protein